MSERSTTESSFSESYINEVRKMLRYVGNSQGIKELVVPLSGRFDRALSDALTAFQKRMKLPPTGLPDSETYEALVRAYGQEMLRRSKTEAIRPYPDSDGYELARGEQSELVFILQLMLNSLSIYYDSPRIPVNGSFDGVTELSVREFQHVNMLPVTGIVDRATWKRLAEEYNETVNDRQ